jgi:hypothetical protein
MMLFYTMPIIACNKINRTIVGADLSGTAPIYRPPV